MSGTVRTKISNNWYRLTGRRISGERSRFSNWRNRRQQRQGRTR